MKAAGAALAAAAMLLVAGCGSVAAASASSLSLQWKAGQTRNYTQNTKMNFTVGLPTGPQPFDVTEAGKMAMQAVSVDPAGTVTLQVTVTPASGTLNGQPLATLPPAQTSTMKIAADGTIKLGGLSSSAGGLSIPGGDQFTPVLPSGKVRPGDTWDRTYTRPNPFGGGQISVTTHNHFLRWDTVNGRQAAVVESLSDTPLAMSVDLGKLGAAAGSVGAAASGAMAYTGRMKADATSTFVPGAGEVLKMVNATTMDVTITFSGSGNPSLSGPMHVTGTLNMNLTEV